MPDVLHALIVPAGRPIPPFEDPPGQEMILNRTLRAHQEAAIVGAGLTLVEAPPEGAPYLLLSDRTWVTAQTLKFFLTQATAPARLAVESEVWAEVTGPLQELAAPGVYEVGLVPPGGSPSFSQLPPQVVDLEIESSAPPEEHPAIRHASPSAVPLTDAPVYQLDHWTHILQANWLAMTATVRGEYRAWREASIFGKIWRVLLVLSRVRSLSQWGLARAVNQIGSKVEIHPTAVVEACVVGDGAKIGPGAVVRGSVIGPGAVIEEQAIVNLSVIGDGAKVGRRATSNLCVAYPGAFFGAANGYQATIFGRESFLAWTVTVFDLAFDKHVKVWHRGERVSSGTYFLGAAIGHRAKLGGLVTLGYGAEVPNDAFLVGESDGVLRAWEPGPAPHRVVDGTARPVQRRAERAPLGAAEGDDPA